MNAKKLFKVGFIILLIIVGTILVFVSFGAAIYRSNTSGTKYTSDVIRSYEGYSGSSFSPSFLMDSSSEYYAPESGYYDTSVTSAPNDRSVIKTGNVTIAVDDIDDTVKKITNIKDGVRATYQSLNDYGKGISRSVSMTIKVEEPRFEELYNHIKQLEGDHISSSLNENDVTEQVTDLQARLTNYRSVENQYLRILESATNVEETLLVYKELNQVRLDIERTETQLKNLETQTKYSYIYINISQSSAGAELEDDTWRPLGVFKEALRALVELGKMVGNFVIWLVVFVPVIALVVIPIVVIQKKRKK